MNHPHLGDSHSRTASYVPRSAPRRFRNRTGLPVDVLLLVGPRCMSFAPCVGSLRERSDAPASTSGALMTETPVDPLPTWRSSAARTSILEFVDAVTTVGSDDFVPEVERVAVF